jgi:glycosyltransferase involved in cell wall biosynthesis
VVPLYNKSSTIQRTIRSILSQTMDDFEVIVVDDGSTDGSAELAREALGSRGVVFAQPNAGPGAARNKGVSEARGQYVAFLDGDDEWLPNYLEESLKALEVKEQAAHITVCGYLEYPEGVSKEEMWRQRGLTEGIFLIDNASNPRDVVVLLAYLSPCTTVMRRDLFLRCGGFFEKGCRYGEDAYLMLRVMLHTPVYVRLTPLVAYHREDSGLSANLQNVRPIEPFLVNPEEFLEGCPESLRKVTTKVLTLRAYKTACVLGFWSQSKRAREILLRFLTFPPLSSPLLLPAILASTPLADVVGATLRYIRYCRGRRLRYFR